MEPNYLSRRVSLNTFHRNFYQSEYGKLMRVDLRDPIYEYVKTAKTKYFRHERHE